MTQELTTPTDGFDTFANDPASSPIRGANIKFKDGDYYSFSELIDVGDKSFVVLDQQKGWQKLERDCPPEYLMQKKGEPRPSRPHVDEKDWPLNFNEKREHPWKWTTYLWLLNDTTGEILTFWTNTIGGNVAVGELSDQVAFMRQVRPQAMPVVALESREMPTQYGGTTPRPFFHILGWRQRSDTGAPAMLAGPEAAETPPVAQAASTPGKVTKRGVIKIDTPALKEVKEPTSEEILDDEIPFAWSTIYRGYDVAEKSGGQYAIRKNETVVHVAASKQAAKAWIDNTHKKASNPIAAG